MCPAPRRSSRKSPCLLLSAGLALLVVGCAQETSKFKPNLGPQIGQKVPDNYRPGGPYQLSQEELALDCKKLTGRMQVRILQVRDAGQRTGGSAFAQTTQSVVTPVIGGTSRGADPAADYARDRAYLEALNRQLAEKKCAAFDLDAELQPRSFRDTPTPVPLNSPPPKKR